MGLGDFLADVGRGTAVGQIAGAFGGRNQGQRAFDIFINKELPELTAQIQNAETEADIRKSGLALITAGLRRGIRSDQLERLMGMVVGPALANVRAGEIDKIRKDYGPQPAQPRPEGVEGPLTPSGAFIEAKPERALDQEGMLRLGQAVGANPQGFNQLLRTPAQIAEDQASAKMHEESQRKTGQEIEALQAKQKAIQGLPETPIANTGVSPRALGQIGGLGQFVTQSMPMREDALDEDRRRLIAAQTEAARARAGEANRGGRGSQIMQDFVRQGGDPNDVDAFMEYADRYKAAGQRVSESITESADPIRDRKAKLVLDQQAEEAGIGKLPPKEQAAAIKKMAADLGYEIEGNPQVGKVGATLGFGGETSVTGITGWRRKPTTRTTTRKPAGGVKQPTGKSTSKRIRFDAQGNQIAD